MAIQITLSVFFQDPFWIGLVECQSSTKLACSRIVFGSQPSDAEVWELLLHSWPKLHFSPAVEAVQKKVAPNPKRRQRQIGRQLTRSPLGTKSQQALKAQRELAIDERHVRKHKEREAEKNLRFALKQAKRKEKHKGH